jgi:hypothetical protein
MTERKSWQELLDAPVPVSLINEPLEPEPETATARARRRWGMPTEEGERDAFK